VVTAKYHDGICELSHDVSIYSNSSVFRIFPADTTICQGESVLLTTETDSKVGVIWREKHTGIAVGQGQILVNPTATTIYQAEFFDSICHNRGIEEIVVNVVQKPDFKIVNPATAEAIKYGTEINFMAVPNATMWTTLEGRRVLNPEYVTTDSVYVAWLKDEHNFCVVSDTIALRVLPKPPDSFLIRYNVVPGCPGENNARIDVHILGKTGEFVYSWNDGFIYTGSTEHIRENMAPGNYWLEVTCKDGITGREAFLIREIRAIEIQVDVLAAGGNDCDDGRIYTTISGGTPPYYYTWSDDPTGAINDPSRFHMNVGLYMVTITDAQGCEQTAVADVICEEAKRILPSLYISPNNDGENDYLDIKDIESFPNNIVIIFNSWGEEIITLRNYDNVNVRWDGRNSKGQIIPDGVYYYILRAQDHDSMMGWILMKTSKTK
jgi:gliding motility-associated-like protein